MGTQVRALGLTKVFGRRTAVRELELEVPEGIVFGLLGENGAGKSTTIRMLLGLIQPTAGSVELFGRPLSEARLELLAGVGCLVEGPAFYPYLSGARNLKLFGDLACPAGVTPERVEACLERVGLGGRGDDAFGGYSTGMRQRLGIAAAIVHEPQLVILDEPLNGLDPPAILLVRDLITALARDEGKTVLVSSHLLHEVEVSCERVAILRQGRLVIEGSVSELLQPGQARLEVRCDQPPRAAELAEALAGVSAVERVPDGFHCELEAGRAGALNRALVEAGVEVEALVPRRRTLEELFHALAADPEESA